MKMYRKFLMVIPIALSGLAITACGSGSSDGTTTTVSAPTPTTSSYYTYDEIEQKVQDSLLDTANEQGLNVIPLSNFCTETYSSASTTNYTCLMKFADGSQASISVNTDQTGRFFWKVDEAN